MNITKTQLEYMVSIINDNSKNKYGLDFAYGKCRLVRELDKGGIIGVTAYGTRCETYRAMSAIYAWLLEERV